MSHPRVAAVLFSLALLPAMGGGESDLPYRDGERITVEGRIRLVGNEPFTRLVVQIDDGQSFYLPDEVRHELTAMQGRTMRLSGTVRIRRLKSADRKHTIIEVHLTAVDIAAPR